MPTSVINIKTDPKVKEEAKKIASELGLTLSSVINAQLKQFIRSKSIFFSLNSDLEMERLKKEMESFDSLSDEALVNFEKSI